MRIAFFTAGTVGLGHAVRGLAIARALRRRGCEASFRIFSPIPAPADHEWAEQELVRIVPAELDDPRCARETELARSLLAYKPDLLIVDLFWAPLRHIRPALSCEAWLLLRYVPLWWFAGSRHRSFVRAQFTRIFALEPLVRWPDAEPLDPVVISNPEECQPRGSLRERLGLAPDRRLVVAMQAGRPGEALRLGGGPDCVRWDSSLPSYPFPAAEWLGDADEILSGTGYNSFWEAVWLGYASRVRFVPFPRSIDDQRRRLNLGQPWRMSKNGADVLAACITGRQSH